MAKQAYYAVKSGRKTGVFTNWDECKAQVTGYSGAIYKKFNTPAEAQQFAGVGSNAAKLNVLSHSGGSNYGSRQVDFTPNKAGKSSSKSMAYYAVARGHQVGLYNNWDECKEQITDYNNARYKKFATEKEARDFIAENRDELSAGSKVPKPTAGEILRKRNNAKSKQNYYGIVYKNGDHKIVNTWAECAKATRGVQGATFKKFDNLKSAEIFTSQGESEYPPLSPRTKDERTRLFLENNSKELLKEQKSLKPHVIFCDGSFIPQSSGNDKAGFGVYYGDGDSRNVAVPIRTGPKNSFISEVKATAYVLRQICNEIDEYKKGEVEIMPKYAISSDSETVKNILHQYADTWTDDDYAKHKDVPELKQMIQDYKTIRKFYNENSHIFDDFKFGITWVKGHVGIEGNEEADRLAREGADLSVRPC